MTCFQVLMVAITFLVDVLPSSAEQRSESVPNLSIQQLTFFPASRTLRGMTMIRPAACTIDQSRNCQQISDTCGLGCEKLLSKALTECMNICSCNYYLCKNQCDDKVSMPPSCQQ